MNDLDGIFALPLTIEQVEGTVATYLMSVSEGLEKTDKEGNARYIEAIKTILDEMIGEEDEPVH